MDLIVEIGCEEIPARFIRGALERLENAFRRHLDEQRLRGNGAIGTEVMGTPRRLMLRATGLPARQEDREEELLGPRVDVAYDSAGAPTKACMGFARGQGVEPSDLERIATPKGEVVGLRRTLSGQSTREVLPGLVGDLLGGLSFPKAMRWGDGEHLFVRPVHWLLVLLDDEVVPVRFMGVESSRQSRGHRFASPEPFDLASVASYEEDLLRRHVVVRPEERRRMLVEAASQLAAGIGGEIRPDADLEQEVTFLVEMPVPLLGRFDQDFLALPEEVLVAAMRNHQRYFSVQNSEGRLLNAFIAVGNTPIQDPDVVRYGNERVLTARLRDAEFFFDVDRETTLAERVPHLQEMVFQADLGTYYEKAHRMGNLAVALAYRLGLGSWDRHQRLIDSLTVRAQELVDEKERFSWQVARACLLSKTDLLTEMVGEFPELQGNMGGVYAHHAGEEAEIADAIREHHSPRHAGDAIPSSDLGAVVSLADRLDTLAGGFGVGLRPTGTADPYALRRQCLGVIAIVLGRGYHISLRWMLQQAVGGVRDKVEAFLLHKAQAKAKRAAARKKQPAPASTQVDPFEESLVEDLVNFFAGRLKQRLAEATRPDVVDAVLSAGMDDLYDAVQRADALSRFSRQPAFEDLAIAFKRVANIIKDFGGGDLDAGLLDQPAETRLHEVFLAVAPGFEKLMEKRLFFEGMELLARELRGPVDRFFDEVLVNDPDDPARQANRKALLSMIGTLFGRIADFTRLQGRDWKQEHSTSLNEQAEG